MCSQIRICICCWKGMLSSRLGREASEAASTPGFYPGVSRSVARAAAPAVLPHLFKMWRVRRADSQSHRTRNLPCSCLKQHRQHLPGGGGFWLNMSSQGADPALERCLSHLIWCGHCVTSAGRGPPAVSICPWICSQTDQPGRFQGRRSEGDDIWLVCRCQCSL